MRRRRPTAHPVNSRPTNHLDLHGFMGNLHKRVKRKTWHENMCDAAALLRHFRTIDLQQEPGRNRTMKTYQGLCIDSRNNTNYNLCFTELLLNIYLYL